jgi:hypothetical protein
MFVEMLNEEFAGDSEQPAAESDPDDIFGEGFTIQRGEAQENGEGA